VPDLHLIPLFLPPEAPALTRLADRLTRIFAATVHVRPPHFDPERAFDGSRGQYNSTSLLAHLLGEAKTDDGRVLGVASVDLFIPIFTHVFGEAQLGGRAAVVSTYRLDNRQYGLPENERLLVDRLVKEATHELGHTYGLVHCSAPRCVMRSSSYVEDVDLKSEQFCSGCRPAVRAAQTG
jgi:archaemetzincin